VFDDEVDDSLPCEPHDALIDLIVTPSRIIEIN
jgi:5-formyltetrahydrofolate cyclo-ligase